MCLVGVCNMLRCQGVCIGAEQPAQTTANMHAGLRKARRQLRLRLRVMADVMKAVGYIVDRLTGVIYVTHTANEKPIQRTAKSEGDLELLLEPSLVR